jgi:subtilisin family serine protease
MATPHVAGVVALIISANPALAGHVEDIEGILLDSAVPLTAAQTCGGIPGSQVPNPVYGRGRLDAFAAYELAVQWPTGAPGAAAGDGAAGLHVHDPSPNPASGAVTLRFEIARARSVTVDVIDVTGRRVQRLGPEGVLAAGSHERVWDGRAADGRRVASGTYFLHVHAGAERRTHRVTIAR